MRFLLRSKELVVLQVMIAFVFSAKAQKLIDKGVEFWPQYYLQVPVDSLWSVSADYSDRYDDFNEKVQWIGRIGVNHQLNSFFSASAGYAYSEYFTNSGTRRENRPWQQLAVAHKYRFLRFSHRLRLEERFQRDDRSTRYNYRLRYQFQVQAPILKKQKGYVFISDEPMINFGKELNDLNKFDQNRLQIGLQFKLFEEFYLTPAYMSTYQIQSNKKDFRSLDIWRVGITYRWE
ncbi:DUF2490 domain-containing protein [Desertivirga arenae]|uniref:DUF2490 domain-containing protein n=1 Tax=Desertivirga arenae TaxID=2810309 RepID=UPI001A96B094|nr:DUF2490 domain-containing protein [Pedobacter sp. SYSU D00823]